MANGINEIIAKKFDEWTRNLNPLESRIKIFECIRDIPYVIIPEIRNPEKGPVEILELNKGSCTPKHFLLAIMFQKSGISVKYVTYPFRWAEQNVDYPQALRKLAEEMPVCHHVACKAFIDKKWVLVDATWDLPLKRAGFIVNEKWDGISDTKNAVKPLDEIVHNTTNERMEYVKTKTAWLADKENSLSDRFFNEFNKWLEEVRRCKASVNKTCV